MNPSLIVSIQQIGVGAAFILFPLIFIFAFSGHPGLLKPRLLAPEEIIRRARGNKVLQLGHGLVLLSTALLIVMAVHFMQILNQGPAAWIGMAGAALAILGAILLAADKGALCLTMSALDTIPDEQFSTMLPGLLAMFSKKGWMILLWGIVLLPAGFALQTVGLMQAGGLPVWQSALFLVGVLLISVPDGMEIINLSASILMAVALLPYGVQLILTAF